MILRQRLAIGSILTGVSCLPNGYQFIRQGYLVNFGWGLVVAGSALTLLGAYLFYSRPKPAPEAVSAKNIRAKGKNPNIKKKAKK